MAYRRDSIIKGDGVIHHCVFFTFSDEIGQKERTAILDGLAQLVDDVPGLRTFSAGPNVDIEQKSPAYRDGFVGVFDDRESLARYAVHPKHLELGQRLVAGCVGEADGIIVFDLESS